MTFDEFVKNANQNGQIHRKLSVNPTVIKNRNLSDIRVKVTPVRAEMSSITIGPLSRCSNYFCDILAQLAIVENTFLS